MRIRIFVLTFCAAFLVCGNAFSTCTWKCTEQVEAHFMANDPVPGQPQQMKCVYFPNTRGKMFYTDRGMSNAAIETNGLVPYEVWPGDSCTEACWQDNGPISWEEATFHAGPYMRGEYGWIMSYRCVVSGTVG